MSCVQHAAGDRCLKCGHGITGPESSILHDRYRINRNQRVHDVSPAVATDNDESLPWGEPSLPRPEPEPEYVDPSVPRVYTYCLGVSYGGYSGIAIAQSGTVLYRRNSSSRSWLQYDLAAFGRPRFVKHFGDARFHIEWVEKPDAHEGLQAALARNAEREAQV